MKLGLQPLLADGSIAVRPTRPRRASATGLLGPLDNLLVSGGDVRLALDPVTGVNKYGCKPGCTPDVLGFSSSTATSISARAYDRANLARDQLLRSALAVGFDRAFDNRVETMREELKAYLNLADTGAEVVFSPSGTDSQLHALFVTRALLGADLTTIVVAADQTGSGTAHTARGRHFSERTASGGTVTCAMPLQGLGENAVSMALPASSNQSTQDDQVIAAVASAVAGGSRVLLQIMESSKLGWRLPSDACVDEIARRWPDEVQIVVDACQLRIGRPRLRAHLARGHMVLITGSKYFAGPAFSGALLIPSKLAKAVGAIADVPQGLLAYSSASDWPQAWDALRPRFPVRHNLGQWLRWEAALEEIRGYYEVPIAFRRRALTAFAATARQVIAASPFLRLLPPAPRPDENPALDEEMSETTIFPFTLQRDGVDLAPAIYRGLQGDCSGLVALDADIAARQLAAKICLVGQPVALTGTDGRPAAALRICADARFVTSAWSPDAELAQSNIARALAGISTVVAKIGLLLDGAELR